MSEVHYQDYLDIKTILSAQKPKTQAHDEMLFIIVHQCYELWFKQIHHEMDSVIEIFSLKHIPEEQLAISSQRLHRILKILEIFVQQLSILETMDPIHFLDFRESLKGASGFQSLQFRELEVKLGISLTNNPLGIGDFYYSALKVEDAKKLRELNANKAGGGLFHLVESWLERTPFVQTEGYTFWKEYKQTLENYFQKELALQENLPPEIKNKALQETKKNIETFSCLFEEESFAQLQKKQNRRLSRKATLAALFITLYKNHPLLFIPYKILLSLVDMDELLSTWRFRHALMAHRMIGPKVGTGGSSGYQYLTQATLTRRPFEDFFDLTAFLIPSSLLPSLPKELSSKLNFQYSSP